MWYNYIFSKGGSSIKWLKCKFSKLFNDYISNILLIGLSSFITYSLNYFKYNLKNNNFETTINFLFPIIIFLLYLFIFITSFLLLNFIRKLIVSKRHKDNLIKSAVPLVFIAKQPMKIGLYNTELFDMKFEISIYESNFINYCGVDKLICTECNGEVKFKEETVFGNFTYICRVCNKELKYKYDYYTIRNKVEEMVNSEIRSKAYEDF